MNLDCIVCKNTLDVTYNAAHYQSFLCKSCKISFVFQRTSYSERDLTNIWFLNDSCDTNEYKYLFMKDNNYCYVYEYLNKSIIYKQALPNLNDRDMFLFAIKLVNNLVFV